MKEARLLRGMTQEQLAKMSGIPRSTIGRLESSGEPIKKANDLVVLNMCFNEIKDIKESGFVMDPLFNAKDIGEIYDEHGDTKFTEISPGWWGMMVELVPEYAKAGYLSSYSDQEFIEELPKHYFTVDKFVRGKYRAFEITGDSMDNGKIEEAIPDGSIVLCRELKKDAWKSKLHSHKWPNWIFVHKYEGIICKQIAHQDVPNGVLTLRSLNPDKEKYPDITVYMDDLEQIYNVILRQLR